MLPQIKIGRLTFNPKALGLFVLCFFMVGLLLGAFTYSSMQSGGRFNLVGFLFPALLICAYFFRLIGKEVEED